MQNKDKAMKTSTLIFILFFFSLLVFGQDSTLINKDVVLNKLDSDVSSNLFNVLSVMFGIVGVIGTIYTIQARISQKKEGNTYKYLFELADKNIDKNVTDDLLKQKKDEVKKQSEKIIDLQNKIEKEIPRQARMAVLRDKYYTQSETLIETYTSLKKINEELDEVNLDITIPKEILLEIENEIAPKYLIKEKRSNFKNYITVITTVVAIISALLPYPFDRWITFPLLLIAVPFVYQLLQTYLPQDKKKRKFVYANILRKVFLIVGGISLILSLTLIIFWSFDFSRFDFHFLQIITCISLFIIFLGVMYHMRFLQLRKKMANT